MSCFLPSLPSTLFSHCFLMFFGYLPKAVLPSWVLIFCVTALAGCKAAVLSQKFKLQQVVTSCSSHCLHAVFISFFLQMFSLYVLVLDDVRWARSCSLLDCRRYFLGSKVNRAWAFLYFRVRHLVSRTSACVVLKPAWEKYLLYFLCCNVAAFQETLNRPATAAVVRTILILWKYLTFACLKHFTSIY